MFENDHLEDVGRLRLSPTGQQLLHLPCFNVYEICFIFNCSQIGFLELSVCMVFIVRHYEEIMPLRRQQENLDMGPIRDDLGIALLIALDILDRLEPITKQSGETLPVLKGQHLASIRYRVKDTVVDSSDQKFLTKNKFLNQAFPWNGTDTEAESFQSLYDQMSQQFISVYEYWNGKVIEQSKYTFFFSSKFKKLVRLFHVGHRL